jgi:hypothetical protein
MSNLAIDGNAKGIQCLRPATTEKLEVATAAAVSFTAVPVGCNVIRLLGETDVNYSLDGTATFSDVPLPNGSIEFISVRPGDVLSVIASTTTGDFYVTVMV